MKINMSSFEALVSGYYNITVECTESINGCFYKTYKEIKGANLDEAFNVVKKLVQLAENTIFLEDMRFTGNTYVMAQMAPQTNSSRFFDHILDANNSSSWVKGYIIAETTEHIMLLVGDKYEVECFKENVIILKD